MPANDKRLDDAIRTALRGGGHENLHQVMADMWRQMTDKAMRSLDIGRAEQPASVHVRVVNLQP